MKVMDQKVAMNTRKGTLETKTFVARCIDGVADDGCVYDLWFEYPSQSGEAPNGVAIGSVIYIIGYLVSTGQPTDESMSCHVHVNDYYFTAADFTEAVTGLLASDASNIIQVAQQMPDANPNPAPTNSPWATGPQPAQPAQAPAQPAAPAPQAQPQPQPQPAAQPTAQPEPQPVQQQAPAQTPAPAPAEDPATAFDPEEMSQTSWVSDENWSPEQ